MRWARRAGAAAMLAAALCALGGEVRAEPLPPRIAMHHLLRRFAFSAPPEYVSDAINNGGPRTWLDRQLSPDLDDSALRGVLEPKPTKTDRKGELVDYKVFERRLAQRQVNTRRQLREKVVLHWLDHFSVSVAKVGDYALMGNYEETLRAGALGNFKKLLVAVARDPAMLLWLDNNGNDGTAAPKNPPNENFARELLQLYTIGTQRLNPDGSLARDEQGQALPNYAQSDIREFALALSGWSVDCNDAPKVKNPNTRCKVGFHPDMHPKGVRRLLGTTLRDPGTATSLDAVMDVLARHPSTAPFQARELLQRFVDPDPSPRYIADIAKVWADSVDAPDQIAQVVRAIALHPEFGGGYHRLVKQPAELTTGLLRELPSALKPAHDDQHNTYGAGTDLVVEDGYLASMGQSLYAPPSVFSFYRPGDTAPLMSETYLAARLNFAAVLQGADVTDGETNTALDFEALTQRIGSNDPRRIARYLLDAMVDGGSPVLRTAVTEYLQESTDETHLRGAVWLIASSPEYQVN